MAKKVGQTKADVKSEKKAKTVKIMAPGELNESGQYVTFPSSFDHKLHKNLKKTDFSTGAGFLNFRAMLLDQDAARRTKLANEFRSRAEILSKYKSDDQRKKAEKIARLQATLEKMQKEIDAENGDDADTTA